MGEGSGQSPHWRDWTAGAGFSSPCPLPAHSEAHMLRRTPISVLVADDHPLIREGIIASLGRAEDIRVVGEARNGEEAVMLVTDLRPDVVLMDLDMPTMDGVTAIHILTEKFPGLKILVPSAYEDNQHVYPAMQAGAVGYVIKRTNQASLLNV